jgi:hypothetical protein
MGSEHLTLYNRGMDCVDLRRFFRGYFFCVLGMIANQKATAPQKAHEVTRSYALKTARDLRGQPKTVIEAEPYVK